MTSTCMRLDIRNFLRNQGARHVVGFKTPDGTEATDAQIRAFLYGELAIGHQYMPLCQHNNFDHATGWCRGQKQGEQDGNAKHATH